MRDMESSGRIDMDAYRGEPNMDDNAGKYGGDGALQAVRQAFGLDRHVPVDYEAPRLGLFDPALLSAARDAAGAAAATEKLLDDLSHSA